MTYNQTIEYLYNSQPVFHLQGASAYKPGLDNTRLLLQKLNNPHLQFKSIHIAGTNGKGSTSHILAAVMQQSGYKTGLYTSPHLKDYRERMRIDGKMIPKRAVMEFVKTYKELLEEVKPSFFETTMAMAFWWFKEQQVDIAVIETGLGGRLDSTNIITPEVSVITNIGFDHTEFLGNSLQSIAQEKAGIIKPQVAVVIGQMTDDISSIFLQKAEQEKSQLIDAATIENSRVEQLASVCQLKGSYQQKNIRTALATIDVLQKLGWSITENNIKNGVSKVVSLTGLEGRWQQLEIDSFGGKQLRKPIKIILDTGHNSHGVSSYIEQLKSIRPLQVVFGMVADKDVKEVMKLLPRHATYYFTQPSTSRAMTASNLKQLAANVGIEGKSFSSIREALKAALVENKSVGEKCTIFIGGSNYLIGEVLQLFE